MNAQRYVARKRKKPSVFGPKFLIGDGVHNASKRHRDRLNSEMEDLAAALPLPTATIAKLDKLSVLRLSVGFLRARAFFQQLDATGRTSPLSPDQTPDDAIDSSSISGSLSARGAEAASPSSPTERGRPRHAEPPAEPLRRSAGTSELPAPPSRNLSSPGEVTEVTAVEVTAGEAGEAGEVQAPRDLVDAARIVDASSVPPSSLREQRGRAVEQRGRAVEQRGRAVEQRGRAVEQRGRAVEQRGRAVEQRGRAVEQRGRAVVPRDGGRRHCPLPFPGVVEPDVLLESMGGVLLVVMADGTVFYVSENIQQYLGFNQTDVILESVFDLIHTEDRAALRSNLRWDEPGPPLPGKRSTEATGQQRTFSCRFRCLLDNNSGFMMLQIQGKLKRLPGGGCGGDVDPPGGRVGGGTVLFALATPHNPILPSELRLWNIIFTTKHKLDFTTISLDSKARLVMGYNAVEFRKRKAACFQHMGDMLYLKKNNLILMKNGESEPVVFRLLSKQGKWLWVKASARIVYRKGKADFIIATQFLLRDEEGEYYLKNRSPDCVFNVTGEAIAISQLSPVTSQPPKATLCRSSSSDNSSSGDNNNRSSKGDSSSGNNRISKAGQHPTRTSTSKTKKSAKNCSCVAAEPAPTARGVDVSYVDVSYVAASSAGESAWEKRDAYCRPAAALGSPSSGSAGPAASSPSEWEESLTDCSTLPDDAAGGGSPPAGGLAAVPGGPEGERRGRADGTEKEDGDRGFLSLLNRHDVTGLDVAKMLGMDAMGALDEGYTTGSDHVSMDAVLEGVLRDMDGAGGRCDDEALLHPSLSEGLPPSVWMFLQSMDHTSASHCEQTVPQLSAEGPASEGPASEGVSDAQLGVIGGGGDVEPSLELPDELGALKSAVRALNACPVWGVIKQRN